MPTSSERQEEGAAVLPAREVGPITVPATEPAAAGARACLHTLVEAQADRAPAAEALCFGRRVLTYAEVEARANRVAHALRARGVGPEARVGLVAGRGPEALVGVLGVLKAGAAYVPVDAAAPPARIAWVLEDAGVSAVLAESRLAPSLPSSGRPTLLLDDEAAFAPFPDTRPAPLADPENLAYVIYTSGSTGTPKGVLVEHRGACNLVRAQAAAFEARPGERVLHWAPLHFDASVVEVFLALSTGGTLVLADEETLVPGPALVRFLAEERIAHAKFTPTALAALPHAELPALRTLVVGGEACPAALAARWAAGRRMWNVYGPTECTVRSSMGLCRGDGRAPSIGTPLPGTQSYVLDEAMQPVGMGVEGELYVGGVGVARGYLGRPGMTAERFVPDPFGGSGGARLYRTGDRARWNAEGELEFLGRADDQVKIRGVRIEPGEVAGVLRGHPAVREAAVVARADEQGETRLVAYIVPSSSSDSSSSIDSMSADSSASTDSTDSIDTTSHPAITASELRAFLRERLPEVMVPSAFVPLDGLPLNRNGKLDRAALPAPVFGAEEEYEAPRTGTERKLAAIWAEVLGRERVGVRDDFFALGGHSLRAARVLARVRDAFGVELPARVVFEASTVAALAPVVERAAGDEAARALPPIAPADRTKPLPLSAAQQRLWFLDQMAPGSPFYNLPSAIRLRGALDAAALERALSEIVRRHEVLRTSFAMDGDDPVQVIHDAAPFILPVDDLSSSLASEDVESDETGRDEADGLPSIVRSAARDEARAPFDLAAGPLFRARLFRLSADDHLLVMTIHHVISDGWSTGVLFRELGALYGAFRRGGPSGLAPLPVQFADFAAWEREHRGGAALDASLAWWKEALAGTEGVLDLPTDRPRPAAQSFAGATHAWTLPAEVGEGARALGRREGATLYMVLLAAFQALMGRYARQDDVVVGSPAAGRGRTEVEGLVGFFVNTLAIRADLHGEPSFRALLARVREAALGAFAHQEVPFERLVDELGVERNLSRNPLVQATFALHEAKPVALEGLRAEQVEVDPGTSRFDLSLAVTDGPAGMRAVLEYSTDLFDAPTIRRLAGHFQTLLAAAVARPDERVAALPLMGEAERRQVLEEWNDNRHDDPTGLIHALFEAAAAAHPDRTAIIHGERRLTYAELNARANRLAHALRARSIRPETLVAVCLERNPESIIAVLGVLKAGAAYLPVDPTYPAERIVWMLEDSATPVILTQERLVSSLPPTSAEILRLDADWEAEIAPHPSHDPHPIAIPGNLAYAIYTSGSTGRPKGVQIEHRNTVAFLHWYRRWVAPEEFEGVLGSTSISFDVSIAEVFASLSWGGTLVLVDNALALADVPSDVVVRRASMAPSAAAELVRLRGIPPTVRTMALAGEALPPSVVRDVYSVPTVERVENLYGPTEDTTYSTYWLAPRGAAKVLIGKALDNSQAYVLDPYLNPVPAGVPGEVYLAGAGVSRGYGKRPAMTAERYVPNPYGAPGSRMYRVGDLARWTPEGELEFLGRLDHQVKVRGFRIELGEVEAVILSHPAVEEAVAVARSDDGGPQRLVAYFAAREPVTAAELRAHLGAFLPRHMVPSVFVELDALPRNPNGKVDRKRLPAPGAGPEEAEYVAPRTPAEELLAGMWAEVLGVERVGARDNFFDLGGHSLLATRVVWRVRELFGVELPLRAVFEAPTVGELAGRIERAREEVALPPVRPVSREEALPLSFAQQRLWFFDRLHPGSATYNVPSAIRLRGALDVAALERALSGVADRHEALRTTFTEAAGQPVQVIHPASPVALPVEDVDGEDALRIRIEAEARAPFDLERGPVFRARLFRAGADDHVLLFVVHHVASDGWSEGVILRDLSSFYSAFANGESSPLAPLPVQYADFAAWQRTHLEGEALEAQLAWWKDALAGASGVLELPTDRPRPPAQSYRGATVVHPLPAGLMEAVRLLSRREGATPFMTLLAAFQAVLHRWTGQDDLVVGTPVSGRGRSEVEDVVGFFVNVLPLRTAVEDEVPFRALLGRVREATLGMFAHQDAPLERIVDIARVQRDLSRSPLFQVVFQVEPAGELPSFPGVEAGRVDAATGLGVAKFDLTLAVEEGDAPRLLVEYATELFDAGTVERFAAHYVALLAGAVESPDAAVSALPMLSDDERRTVVADWNATDRPIPLGRLAHELFEDAAARSPDAVAVASDARSVSYGALNARANRLANRLRALGVGPEVRVGIVAGRSPESVAGIAAVLKAGGAYVPVDPAHPPDRIAFLLRDAGVRVVLADRAFIDRIPSDVAPILLLDDDFAGEDERNPDVVLAPESLAYVIYTSGSTGTPKGVEVSHGALLNLVHWHRRAFGLTPRDRTTLLAGVGFDASVWELWPALATGAALHVPADEARSDPERLRGWIVERGITVSFLPTPLAEAVLPLEWPAGTALRLLLTGGDALRVRPAADLPFTLVNNYGPTENTVVSTSGPVATEGEGAPSIGMPIDNTRVYVLDGAMNPAPVGVAGELYVGGASLARGYHGRPALTAAAFVPDPFSARPGARLYRTGDRVRWKADGGVEFLGRVDFQVKVRGYRIELGEIEAVLVSHPAVREAVVVAADHAGEKRLVAYVVGSGGAADPTALKAWLKDRLPEYMVPGAFVTLPALPLTPNGKVDRRALPAPDFADEADQYAAPRTEAEELLAALWCNLLGVERVGQNDHFFDRGGHSLLATRLVSWIRDAFGVELPVRAVFEAPTLAGLAAEIGRARGGPALPPVTAADRSKPLPLSFGQRRLWFLDRMEPGSAAYNIPGALRLRGAIDTAALERSLGEIVARHEALRTTYAVGVDGEPVQVIHPAAPFVLPVRDLSGVSEGASGDDSDDLPTVVRAHVDAEAARPFDLERGPVFRAELLRIDSTDHVLLTNVHHIASDGWSAGVFGRELAALYGAFARGEEATLPMPAAQYADFAAWQQAHLSGAVLEGQLAWWREALRGTPGVLELPADRPRPANPTYRGAVRRVPLAPGAPEGARRLARREGATPFMALLAAFQAALQRWTGQDDVVVGVPASGRTQAAVEETIGFFVNTLPVRGDLSGDPDVRTLLGRVRDAVLGAFAHQDAPLERIVEAAGVPRDPSRAPLFQVLFAVQPAEAAPELAGLRAEAVETASGTSKFDLSLFVEEGDAPRMAIEYATDLFDAATIDRMAGHFERLLIAAAERPEARVSTLPMLGEEELRRVTADFNDTDRPYPTDETVTDLFEEQVRRTPDAEALVFGAESVTYAELNARANRLAHHLRSLGVGPETMVGVCMERDPELVVALLGVLKSGGAYLPLDPAYPAERIRQFLDDSRAPVVLTQERVAAHLPPTSARVVRVDQGADAAAIASRPGHDPAAEARPENLCWAIYTSGSTGVPKGVQIEHRSAVAFLHWMREFVPVAHWRRVLFSTSVSFDVSVAEVFAGLCSGGAVVLVENALSLAELPESAGVTRASMVPGAAAELLRLGKIPPSMKSLGLAGEALPPATARALTALGTLERVENLYGPTEDTTYSTWWIVPPDAQKVLIGRALANSRVYVLDAHFRPVAVGAPGELYLAGAGTARGYAGKPAATAERFVPDPFGPAGARMYRTGDLARWTAAGELEYLGRSDFQVKVRGHRIELGEIESVLLEHPSVREAVVVARPGAGGAMQLVAYLAGPNGAGPDAARAHVKARLPDYMMPAAFVCLDALPRTPNGKVDRRSLPEPAFDGGREGYVAPRTPAETAVADVWAELLGHERVGALDNFFALGGHSLLATSALARLGSRFGITIPLRVSFEAQTVEEMARAIDQRLAGPAAPKPAPKIGRARADYLASKLDDLSEDDLDALLRDLGP